MSLPSSMARKNESPHKAAMWEILRGYLKENDIRIKRRIVKRAVYIALGIDMNGKKDVPGMYVRENESAKFRLSPSDRGCLSADGDPAVHHPPNQELYEICVL